MQSFPREWCTSSSRSFNDKNNLNFSKFPQSEVFFLTICSKIFLLLICCLWGFFSKSSISSIWKFANIWATKNSLKLEFFLKICSNISFVCFLNVEFLAITFSNYSAISFDNLLISFLTICSNWSFVVRVEIIWWSKAMKATQLNFSQFRRFGVLQPPRA